MPTRAEGMPASGSTEPGYGAALEMGDFCSEAKRICLELRGYNPGLKTLRQSAATLHTYHLVKVPSSKFWINFWELGISVNAKALQAQPECMK